MKRYLTTAALYSLALSIAHAQVPELINYQGRLVDGASLANGPYAIVFRLYDADSGGTELYVETQTVTVVDGLYATAIGASNAVPGALYEALTNIPCYLEVEIDGNPMVPRERLASIAYALHARETDPAWNAAKGAYATGTPLYVEADPVWLSQKSGYATGTPLYTFTEADPVWLSEKAGYATGTPLYAESDPVWISEKAGYATGTPLYAFTETDPAWTAVSNDIQTQITDNHSLITNRVAKTGDTMTGALTMNVGADQAIVIGSAGTNVAIGNAADALSRGVAVGYKANAQIAGAAVGFEADASQDGAALGLGANGSNLGAAVGENADGSTAGAALGYAAQAGTEGVAVGYMANGASSNIAIGVLADSQGGTNRIAIGRELVNEVDDSIAVRGTLYLDGGTSILYRSTFGSGAWANLLAGLATGTPLYAFTETDPVWTAEKSGYATGTPLYAFTEVDPVWEAAKAAYATGTPVYTETDPVWIAASTNYHEKTEADSRYVNASGDTMTGVLNINVGAANDLIVGSSGMGVSIGSTANGGIAGTAIGDHANGGNVGAAVGRLANGANNGAAIGPSANGVNQGAAIGFSALGYGEGAGVGNDANGANYGAAMGRQSYGHERGASVGAYARGYNFGAALGCAANGANTNVAIGHAANAVDGSERVAIGHGVTNLVDDSAAIRGTLYLDGGTGVYYRTTFGSGGWSSLLAGLATGTPLYAFTETDPVWTGEKSGYATGTPLYVETDPVWTAAEDDYLKIDGSRAMTGDLDMGGNSITNVANGSIVFADGTAISATGVQNWNTAYGWGDHSVEGYATGTPVYVETDPTGTNYVNKTGDTMTGALVNQSSVTADRFFNSNNSAAGVHAATLGGTGNAADGDYAVVGGGVENLAGQDWAVVAGGLWNQALGYSSAIGGGGSNLVMMNSGTIAGGWNNTVTNSDGFVGGGYLNFAGGNGSVIGGGRANIAENDQSVVGGGATNQATGVFSTVPGGDQNVAAGRNSLAAGHRAKASHDGSFVLTDAQDADFASADADTFNSRFLNGYYLRGGPVYGNGAGITNLPAGSYTETDPVWTAEKSGYATGTPVYAESDPVWAAEKSAYATGTPLYVEADPNAVLADGSRAMTGDLDMGGNSITNLSPTSIAFSDGTAIGAADVQNWNTGKLDKVAWQVADSTTNYVKKTGDMMTGALIVQTNISLSYNADRGSGGRSMVTIGGGADVEIGTGANGYYFGAAMGIDANGSYAGAAIGSYANGYNYGAAIGQAAVGYDRGAAIGNNANGSSDGTVIGYYAKAYNSGAAVGSQANGVLAGAAMGYQANGYNYGSAVGYLANSYNYGSAVGYLANAYNNGVAAGSQANGSDTGVALATGANGHYAGVAVGYLAYGYNFGVAVGYLANGSETNVAIGLLANAQGGSERIAFGHNVTNDVDETVRVRGTLYLDGGTGVLYRSTFGSGTWSNLLDGYLTTETDPVWTAEKSGYATGTPVYAETDPVWTAEKSGYATGTPLYVETDPDAVLADGSRAMTGDLDMGGNSITNVADGSIVFADGTAISAAGVGNWNTAYGWGDHSVEGYATGTPVYVETDPTGTSYVQKTGDTMTGTLTINSGAGSELSISNVGTIVKIGNVAAASGNGVAVGYMANGVSGVAVGYQANGNSGVAIGYQSLAGGSSVAVGQEANGSGGGVAINYRANGFNSGVAIGNQACGNSSGVGLGVTAHGENSGVGVGYQAGGSGSGAAVGYNSRGNDRGAALGYQANARYGGVALGYLASAPGTNITIGYQATSGQGGDRISIGRGVTNLINDSAMIRGTLYLEGGTAVMYRAAFGSGAWGNLLDGIGGGNAWLLEGNAGTTPGADFLGTTDEEPLEVRVFNGRALRIEPATNAFTLGVTPNIIGGHASNRVATGVIGATISGGGRYDSLNEVLANHGTVAGGLGNAAAGTAFVGGGALNKATNFGAVVAGGENCQAYGEYTAIGGGNQNRARFDYATVAGGLRNDGNGEYAAIAGGSDNIVGGNYASIGGGYDNLAHGEYAAVGGGTANSASNTAATVPGGLANTAEGAYSFAAGRRAKALHDGAFVWGDSTDADIESTSEDQFIVRASGGVGINTDSPDEALDVAGNVKAERYYLSSDAWLQLDASGTNLLFIANSVTNRVDLTPQ
ncbi:MAG: hypothetical protein JXB04_02675 [Kiritimatiellae bacterium]|nr:hypothetical protein [Kiritimatiellia bacterium]